MQHDCNMQHITPLQSDVTQIFPCPDPAHSTQRMLYINIAQVRHRAGALANSTRSSWGRPRASLPCSFPSKMEPGGGWREAEPAAACAEATCWCHRPWAGGMLWEWGAEARKDVQHLSKHALCPQQAAAPQAPQVLLFQYVSSSVLSPSRCPHPMRRDWYVPAHANCHGEDMSLAMLNAMSMSWVTAGPQT